MVCRSQLSPSAVDSKDWTQVFRLGDFPSSHPWWTPLWKIQEWEALLCKAPSQKDLDADMIEQLVLGFKQSI